MQNDQTPEIIPTETPEVPAKKQGMNLPNKLTVLRVILIPFFLMAVLFLPIWDTAGIAWRILSTVLFAGIAFTDMLDGKIARKYNLVTEFGKFLDPLADKLMIFGAMLAICARYAIDGYTVFTYIYVWATFIVILRELGVTSIRLVVSSNAKIVIAASWAGKVKTCAQIASVCLILLEPVLLPAKIADLMIFSYVGIAAMVFFTLYSGLQYFRAYWPYLNTNK